MNRVTVKAVKSFKGMEGLGFNAKLFIDGKEVAFIIDGANGGSFLYRWSDKSAEAILKAIAAEAEPLPCQFCKACRAGHKCEKPIARYVDSIVAEAVDDFEEEKKLKSWCKTKTVFKKASSPREEWFVMKVQFGPEIKKKILDENPGAKFANEMFSL